MDLVDHVTSLRAEAARANERRLLVIEGDRQLAEEALQSIRGTLGEDLDSWVCLGELAGPWSTLSHDRSNQLLGRTIPGLLIDAIDSLRPNVIGQSIGAVEGGGLIVLLIGDEQRLSSEPMTSDHRLAVPPYPTTDVSRRFRRRFLETLYQHRGVSIVDAASGTLRSDGLMGARPPSPACPLEYQAGDGLEEGYRSACVTMDQRNCVSTLRQLADDEILVVEAHRGRGKSAASGIAAAAFAKEGEVVVVSGPGHGAVKEVFDRAAAVLETVVEVSADTPAVYAPDSDGLIKYVPPHELRHHLAEADRLIVDEAAAVSVGHLTETLEAAIPIAYLTTTHGYEGTGRGFSVRFSEHLEQCDRPVERIYLREPIRYAMGDPIETWQFRALLLDASPPTAEAVQSADPAAVEYVTIDRDQLIDDEAMLRELFGLLVLAHYRTEPDDLLRLLDAPNITVRALLYDGHPVSVAMLAEEGNLEESWRKRLFAGESIRGHMIPDLLTTQLRDVDAGALRGQRFLRIATHDAVRSRGLGSSLIEHIHTEFEEVVDWFGAAFGATPQLLSFWIENGYRLVHQGTTRNPRSGEHSAVLLRPASPSGSALIERHERRLIERLPGQFPDTLDDLDPALVEATARAIRSPIDVDLPEWQWAVIKAAGRGPGQVATAPAAFNRLALAGLQADLGAELSEDQRHLLVRRAIQARPLWQAAEERDLHRGDARNELRDAIERCYTWYRDH